MLAGYSVRPIEFLSLGELIGIAGDQLSYEEDPVSFWAPRMQDVLRISELAKMVNDRPVIWDIGGGNSFFGYLMAEYGDAVTRVIDPNRYYLSQRYMHQNMLFYATEARSLRSIAADMDLVFNAGMPRDKDFTFDILSSQPKIVVYVIDANGLSGVQHDKDLGGDYPNMPIAGEIAQGQSPDRRISYNPTERYEVFCRWQSQSEDQIKWALNGFDPKKYSQGGLIIEVQVRKDIRLPRLEDKEAGTAFFWENELNAIFGRYDKIEYQR